jgi:hypothetical protein
VLAERAEEVEPGLSRPSRWWATWSASATMPEKIGDASLVPQFRSR